MTNTSYIHFIIKTRLQNETTTIKTLNVLKKIISVWLTKHGHALFIRGEDTVHSPVGQKQKIYQQTAVSVLMLF